MWTLTTRKEEIAQHLAEIAISVVVKTTLAKCANPVKDPTDLKSLSQSVTQGGLDRPMSRCTQCKCRVHEISECQDDMDELERPSSIAVLFIETNVVKGQWPVMPKEPNTIVICC